MALKISPFAVVQLRTHCGISLSKTTGDFFGAFFIKMFSEIFVQLIEAL